MNAIPVLSDEQASRVPPMGQMESSLGHAQAPAAAEPAAMEPAAEAPAAAAGDARDDARRAVPVEIEAPRAWI